MTTQPTLLASWTTDPSLVIEAFGTLASGTCLDAPTTDELLHRNDSIVVHCEGVVVGEVLLLLHNNGLDGKAFVGLLVACLFCVNEIMID